jgi:hypothetical protein
MKALAYGAGLFGDLDSGKRSTLTPLLESVTALPALYLPTCPWHLFSNPRTGESQ